MSLSAEQPQSLNVLDVIRGIWKRKMMLTVLTLIGLGIGLITIFAFKPTFQSEAQLIVENSATSFERATSDQQQGSPSPVDERLITSQVAVLKSGDLYGRVVDELKLQDNPEFNPALKAIGAVKAIMIATGFTDDPNQYTPRENAIKTMSTKVTVSGIQDSNIITITSRMNDKVAAASVANALAEAYVAATRESDSGSTDRARQWLGTQITDLRQKVSDSENAVEKYRSEAGLLKGQTTTLGTQQISELNSQITIAETASEEATARASEIRNMLSAGAIESSSDVLSSPLIQNMREQQAAANRKVSELSATYLPNHPKMIAAQKELASINSGIKKEALKVVSSLQGQAKIASERAQALRANLEKMKGRESGANISDVKLKSLEREAQANRTLLESMLSRYADASARQDTSQQPSKAHIIQRAAVPPMPYFPKIGPTIFLTMFAGLALGLGLAFVMEVMSAAANAARGGQRIPTRSHVATAQFEQSYDIPPMIVGSKLVPDIRPPITIHEAQVAVIEPVATMMASGSRIAAIELFAGENNAVPVGIKFASMALSNSCLALKENRNYKALSFISLGSGGPDAALATLATARTLAESKKRVVILDVSSEGGDLEMLAGLPAGSGLTDLVAGNADFTKIISRDPHSTVHIIRKGLSRNQNTTSRMAEKIESVLSALNTIYDFVLVHAGEACSSTPSLVKNCPAAFIFASPNRQRDAVAAAQVLESNGVKAPMFVQLDAPLQTPMRRAASA